MKQVFAIGARFEVNNRNVFETLELAIQALKEHRLSFRSRGLGCHYLTEVHEENGCYQFSFMSGGWDDQKVVWRIYPIDVHNNVKSSGFIFDEKAIKEEQRKKKEAEEKEKDAFVNSLDPELLKKIKKYFR